jgi:hypothetical protein
MIDALDFRRLYQSSGAEHFITGQNIDFFVGGREHRVRINYDSNADVFLIDFVQDPIARQWYKYLKDHIPDLRVYCKLRKTGPKPEDWFLEFDKIRSLNNSKQQQTTFVMIPVDTDGEW